MEDIGELDPLPDRKLSCRQKLRRWYACHFLDILEGIFMLWIGMIMVLALCFISEAIK